MHTPKAIEPPTNSNSIAFGKSTSQRIYPEQHTPKIGWKLHKYGLKQASCVPIPWDAPPPLDLIPK